MSSSHLAHRLQSYALLHYPEHQFNLCIDMLTAYHIDGRHPSDRDLLADLAVKHRIFPDYDFVMAWLDGDECDAEVRRAYVTAHRLGVTGVPFFVFQDRWAASGAMGVDEFVQVSHPP